MSVSYATAKDGTKHTVSVYLGKIETPFFIIIIYHCVFPVEKLTPGDLLRTLKNKGQRDESITKNVICSKLEDKDDEISTTSCKVSMACPLGMAR